MTRQPEHYHRRKAELEALRARRERCLLANGKVGCFCEWRADGIRLCCICDQDRRSHAATAGWWARLMARNGSQAAAGDALRNDGGRPR